MDEQIRHEENGIVLVLSHIDLHGTAVLLHNHTVNGKGNRHPLVLFHAAVIMGVQISETAILIERILFHVQTGGINMCPKNIDAVLHLLLTDLKHHDGFIHPYGIHLVARFELFAILHQRLQFLIARRIQCIYDLVDALPLGLSSVQKVHILSGKSIHFFKLFLIIRFPCVFLLHGCHSSLFRFMGQPKLTCAAICSYSTTLQNIVLPKSVFSVTIFSYLLRRLLLPSCI